MSVPIESIPLERIAETLEFTLAELAMNRVGQLSSHQVWVTVKQAVLQGAIALVYLSGVVAMVFGAAGLTGFRRVAFYTLGLGGLALMLPFAYLNVAAAVTRRVDVHEGKLDLHGTGRGSVAVVGSHRVIISWEASKVLRRGESYRIYSLGYTNEFLSIEPLPPGSRAEGAR